MKGNCHHLIPNRKKRRPQIWKKKQRQFHIDWKLSCSSGIGFSRLVSDWFDRRAKKHGNKEVLVSIFSVINKCFNTRSQRAPGHTGITSPSLHVPKQKDIKSTAGHNHQAPGTASKAPAWRIDGLTEIHPCPHSHFVHPQPHLALLSLKSAPLLWHMTDLVHLQDNQSRIKNLKALRKWRRCGRGEIYADSLCGQRGRRETCRASISSKWWTGLFAIKMYPLTWKAPGVKWPCWWAGRWRTPSGPSYCSPPAQSHRRDDAAQSLRQSLWHLGSGPARGAPEYWNEHEAISQTQESKEICRFLISTDYSLRITGEAGANHGVRTNPEFGNTAGLVLV